jgi:hypothetical protein
VLMISFKMRESWLIVGVSKALLCLVPLVPIQLIQNETPCCVAILQSYLHDAAIACGTPQRRKWHSSILAQPFRYEHQGHAKNSRGLQMGLSKLVKQNKTGSINVLWFASKKAISLSSSK